jgi:hypothetical protein
MNIHFESQFNQIDDILNEFEQSINDKQLLAEIDELCNEIDNSLETRKDEIIKWSDERKRTEAMDSDDPFVLNLLSIDENFNVRTLSACNPKTPVNSLRRLVEDANDYIKMIIAHNPNSSPDILDRITELSIEREVLVAVISNKNVSPITKFKIESRIASNQIDTEDEP